MTAKTEILTSRNWDVCVVGDGASALWAAHGFHREGKSVLWVTAEEPGSLSRVLAKHAWCGNVSSETAARLATILLSGDTPEFPAFEAIYFDARASSKRFRRLQEVSPQWGEHETPWLPELFSHAVGSVDVAAMHDDVTRRYSAIAGLERAGVGVGSAVYAVAAEPAPFLIARSFMVIGLEAGQGRLESIELAATSAKETFTVRAEKFILGDLGAESYADLVKDATVSDLLKTALKGKSFRAGLSLHFQHKELATAMLGQTIVIPIVAHPSKKGAGAHMVGRFLQKTSGELESVWFALLTDEEVEDNNEILKKTKSAKRAIDRAMPGFLESVTAETMQFEPQMMATDLVKKRNLRVLNASVVTDQFGVTAAVDRVTQALT